jgi:UPF0755 protein
MKRVLLILVMLTVAAGGGAVGWLETSALAPAGAPDAPELEFTVPKGASARALGPKLVEAGLAKSNLVWRYHLWRRGGLNAKAGRHLVSARMTAPELAAALEAPPLPEDIPFTVVEGWRLRDTDKALAEKKLIRPGDYLKAASAAAGYKAPFPLPAGTLEGYLYPETYGVVPDRFDVRELVQRQLDTFAQRFWEPNRADIENNGRKLHHLVVMASMLEREEPVPAQRALVAGILWKRLDKGFGLGVDATSRYELEEWNDRKRFLERLADAKDPWNTRTRVGLPPGPIGAPTIDSLTAAMRPEASEFWYYLHDAEKKLHPSRNADEHEKLRAKYGVY